MGNCVSNNNIPAVNRANLALSNTPQSDEAAAALHAEEVFIESQNSSHAALNIIGVSRRVALFADWESKKELRQTDTTARQAGTEAMEKLTIPLDEIGRLGSALPSLPATLDVTLTGIDHNNQHQLAAITLLPDEIKSKIHRLTVAGSSISNANLVHLAGLTELRSLNLSRSRHLRTDGLDHLQGLTKLASLDLSGCFNLSQGDGAPLRFPENVRSLNLSGCRSLTNHDFAALQPLAKLQSLDLSRCSNLTDGAVENLQCSTSLHTLNLSSCTQITDAGIAHLQPFAELQSLSLESCSGITGVGFEHLRELPKLHSLDLSYCRNIDDDGLLNLRGMESLRQLDTGGCPQLSQWSLQHFRNVIGPRLY